MLDVYNLCVLIGATRLPLGDYFEIYELVDGNKGISRLGNCQIPETIPLTLTSNLPSLLQEKNLRQVHLVSNTKLRDSTVIKYYYGHFKRLEIEVVLTLLGYLECDFCQLFSFSKGLDKAAISKWKDYD
ncbi:hypothetical protein CFPU101_48160 [Chroococcus sp. FPU101]|nr:hypothetical protein CFPU101_48160 [Chroococcus sp. FPU101]